MTKLLLKICLVLGLAIGASHYMLYIMTGKSLFSSFTVPLSKSSLPQLSSLKLPTLDTSNIQIPKLPESLASLKVPETSHTPQTLYKWIDEHGVTHYTSEKPKHASTTLNIDPNVNIIQSISANDTRTAQKKSSQTDTSQRKEKEEPHKYAPKNIKGLVNDAKNVQSLINERRQNIP